MSHCENQGQSLPGHNHNPHHNGSASTAPEARPGLSTSGGCPSPSDKPQNPAQTNNHYTHRRAESSGDHLKAIIENVVEGIISIDDHGIIESINPAALRIFGYTSEELIGQNVKMLMPEPYRGHHDGYLHAYRQTGEARIISKGREVLGRRKNGEVFPMDLAVGEVNLPGRRLFTGIIRDISERKNSEIHVRQLARSLQEKNQELESVVYIASHDLRSPLVNIQGFSIELSHSCRRLTQLLDSSKLSEPALQNELDTILKEEIPEALEFIFAGVNKMDGLLSGFLKFSRLGRVSMDQRCLDLNSLIREVLSAMKYQIQQKSARIETGYLPECCADHLQLSQVFTNLIDNALKYSDPDRAPRISIYSEESPHENEIIVVVQDNGVGIRPEHLEKIFDVFFRLQPHEGIGEGLGLAIAKRIVHRLGGRIWVDSSVNEGSRFFLALPIQSDNG